MLNLYHPDGSLTPEPSEMRKSAMDLHTDFYSADVCNLSCREELLMTLPKLSSNQITGVWILNSSNLLLAPISSACNDGLPELYKSFCGALRRMTPNKIHYLKEEVFQSFLSLHMLCERFVEEV